jgi:hypothetical protein
LLENRSVRSCLFFSFVAALCWVIAEATRDIAIASAKGGSMSISFAWTAFNLMICFILSILNLLPAAITRSMIMQAPIEGAIAIFVSFIHYATFYVVIRIPYNVITGTFQFKSIAMLLAILAYLAWAAFSYISAYIVLSMPPIIGDNSMDSLYVPLNDSEKCLTELGNFITLLAGQLGERRQVEKFWSPVYSYLKETQKIEKLVLNKRLRHDEITLNAVGSIAFKLLADGELHAAFGTLSQDGEYVRKVWWVAANELVRRSYYRPEDVTQGIQALDAAIVAVGPKQQ